MKEQKDEADEFLQKQEELGALKSNVTLWKIWKIKHQIEKYQTSSTKILDQLNEKSKQEESYGRSIIDQKKELAKVSKLLVRAEKDLEVKQTELDGSKSSSLETRAQMTSLERRLRELEKSRDHVVQDAMAQKSRVALLKAELDTINGEETRLKEALNSNDKTYQLDEQKIAEYSKLREEVAALTAADKTKSEVLSQEIKSIKLRISQLSREEESVVREITERKRIVADYSSRLAGIKSGMDATVVEMKDVKAQQEKAVDSLNKIDTQVESAKQEYAEIVAELADARDDARRSKQELKEAEAIKTMQKIFVGVHGKLVDLCRPSQKKFAQAVVVASGKHMDAIVVDTKQVATECIHYLKDQRIGTCTFLPLDNLKIKPIPERLRNLGQKYHLCVDLLECEDIFKPAVSYAVGSTVVCDTLDDAQDLCFNRGEKVKVVTVKGHVIGKSGAMTGGTFGTRESANRWEEKDIERLQQRKHEIEELLSKHSFVSERQLILNLDNTYHALQSKLQFSKVEFDTIQEKLNQASQQIQDQETFLISIRSQAEKLTSSCQGFQSEADEIQHNIEQVERQIFSKFSVSLGIQNIREHEEKHAESHQRIFSALKSLNERRTAITGNLEYEKKKKFAEMEELYNRQIVEVQSSVAAQTKKDSVRVEKEGTIVSEIMRMSAEVNELKTQLDRVSHVIRDLNKQHKESIKVKDSLISALSIEELGVEKLRAQLHEVLQTAQVDETSLPTTELDSSELSGSETSKSYWSNDLLKLEARSQASADGASSSHKMSNESSTQSTHFSQSQNVVVKGYV